MVVALLGHGTVGGGVYELLKNRSNITVKYVLDRSPIAELGAVSVTDFSTILNDGEVDTVVEVMGGLEPAHEYMVAAMRAGKNIVTANKHLLAAYYDELTTLAKETGIGFRTSAAVGGGIPWLPNLQRLKRIGAVNEICGIMNGTTNYILSMMHKKGYDYESVLHDAQSFGYAEADPTADIEGYDIQRKLMISANIAFDASLTEQQVPAAGIAGITREDIAGFNEMGYVCKLYATAKRVADGAILAVVEPTLLRQKHWKQLSPPIIISSPPFRNTLVGKASLVKELAAGPQPLPLCRIFLISARESKASIHSCPSRCLPIICVKSAGTMSVISWIPGSWMVVWKSAGVMAFLPVRFLRHRCTPGMWKPAAMIPASSSLRCRVKGKECLLC